MSFDDLQTNDSCFCLPGAMVKGKAKENVKGDSRTTYNYWNGNYGYHGNNGYGNNAPGSSPTHHYYYYDDHYYQDYYYDDHYYYDDDYHNADGQDLHVSF